MNKLHINTLKGEAPISQLFNIAKIGETGRLEGLRGSIAAFIEDVAVNSSDFSLKFIERSGGPGDEAWRDRGLAATGRMGRAREMNRVTSGQNFDEKILIFNCFFTGA